MLAARRLTTMLPRVAVPVSAHSHHAHEGSSTEPHEAPTQYAEHKASMEYRYTTGEKTKQMHRLIWIDCEMSGLDVRKHRLLQVACLVTDGDAGLGELGPGLDLVIHQDEQVLQEMDDWCKDQFAKNGLIEAVRSSKVSLEEAETRVLDYVKKYTKAKTCPLAGNSVSYDRRFLEAYMPRLAEHLHYRNVDVSTVKELCRRWYPNEFGGKPAKRLTHRALDDIRESVEELRYYKRAVFK